MQQKKQTNKRVVIAACLAAAAGCASVATVASADVVTVPALKDAMIFGTSAGADQSANGTNGASGRGPALFAGADGGSAKKRSLIAFDFAATAIPDDAIVTDVKLTMYLGQIAGSGGGSGGGGDNPVRTFRLFRNLQDWGEGNSGSPTSANIGGTGQGFARQAGDSTWDYAFYDPNPANAVLWGSGLHGGNTAAAQSGEATFDSTVTPFTVGAAYSWNATNPNSAGMIADVQAWLDGTSGNYGWQLRSDLEGNMTSFLGFWSRDGAVANTAAGSEPPALTITYVVPEPSSACLALLGLAGAMGMRRRAR